MMSNNEFISYLDRVQEKRSGGPKPNVGNGSKVYSRRLASRESYALFQCGCDNTYNTLCLIVIKSTWTIIYYLITSTLQVNILVNYLLYNLLFDNMYNA